MAKMRLILRTSIGQSGGEYAAAPRIQTKMILEVFITAISKHSD